MGEKGTKKLAQSVCVCVCVCVCDRRGGRGLCAKHCCTLVLVKTP